MSTPPETSGTSGRPEDGQYALGIDLGTGGPKVALVSQSGRVAASAFEPVAMHLVAGGGAEQDPDEWWRAVTRAVRRMLEESGARAADVVGVGCTGQWSGTVATAEDGSPLRPAITWMDSRGSRSIRRQAAGRVNAFGYDVRKLQRWIRLTGGAPGHSGKDPTAHILWIRDNEPDVYRATHKFLEPVDWLNQRLTGRFSASYDSIVVHWVTDNRQVDHVHYDDTLLTMAGLERAKLPDLAPSASVVGPLRDVAAQELGLDAGTPVTTATGDVHSAAVGSGAVADFAAHLYIGTSSWITCHVPFKKTDVRTNVASIPAAVPGRYLVADEHETAGACLTFLAENMGWAEDAGIAGSLGSGGAGGPGAGSDPYRRLDGIAAQVPAGANGVMFTPWLNGERSPVDDHTIRAGFHNLSLATTRSDLVRAVYEGVALNSRWLLEAVEHFVKRRFGLLAFIGGGANSALWAQIHADVTGRPIRPVVEPVLANVRGAGLLVWLALGRIDVGDIARAVEVGATFTPDPVVRPLYDARYAEFVNLYKQTRQIHRRLNRAL